MDDADDRTIMGMMLMIEHMIIIMMLISIILAFKDLEQHPSSHKGNYLSCHLQKDPSKLTISPSDLCDLLLVRYFCPLFIYLYLQELWYLLF